MVTENHLIRNESEKMYNFEVSREDIKNLIRTKIQRCKLSTEYNLSKLMRPSCILCNTPLTIATSFFHALHSLICEIFSKLTVILIYLLLKTILM